MEFAHPFLVASQVGMAQGVGLCDHGNKVDTRAQALHHLNVEGLEGVSSGSDEIQAGVHTHVDLVSAAGLLLLEHVGLVLVIQELNDGLPGVTVVDIVAEAGGINDGQANWRTRAAQLAAARGRNNFLCAGWTMTVSPTFEELLL